MIVLVVEYVGVAVFEIECGAHVETMMAQYRPYDRAQTKMIAISYARQLLPGSFEHALSYLIDNEVDLERFAIRFKNDETGAPAYDPPVLLKLVLFAYSRGISSSRTMARACIENVVFIALACDQQPHFTTLAHFVATLGNEVECRPAPMWRNHPPSGLMECPVM